MKGQSVSIDSRREMLSKCEFRDVIVDAGVMDEGTIISGLKEKK